MRSLSGQAERNCRRPYILCATCQMAIKVTNNLWMHCGPRSEFPPSLYHVPQTPKGLVVVIALFRSLDCPGMLARSRQGRYLSSTEMSPVECSVHCSARSPLFIPLYTSCRSQSIVIGFGIENLGAAWSIQSKQCCRKPKSGDSWYDSVEA
jgi:hypothetical protein